MLKLRVEGDGIPCYAEEEYTRILKKIDKNLLERFIRYTQENLIFPLDQHEAVGVPPPSISRKSGYWWSCDWWTIETAKVLYLGSWKAYEESVLPRRLQRQRYTHNWIETLTRIKFNTMLCLETVCDKATDLFIGEVGRGIEIILALAFKKDWRQIVCYDHVPLHQKHLEDMFGGLNIVFESTATSGIIAENSSKGYGLNNALLMMTGARLNRQETIDAFTPNGVNYVIHNGNLIYNNGKILEPNQPNSRDAKT